MWGKNGDYEIKFKCACVQNNGEKIVAVGAGFAGFTAAHKIIKETIKICKYLIFKFMFFKRST